MTVMRRHLLRTLVVGGTALAVLAAMPAAIAATALPPNTPVLTATPGTYSFSTTLPYWSVVAVRPSPGADVDLRLFDPNVRGTLTGSYLGTNQTDVIAINSNARPLGNYLVEVSQFSGAGNHSLIFWEQREVMPVPTDPVGNTSTAWGINFVQAARSVQVYLAAGQGFRVYHGDDTRVFLAGSTPGAPSTALRNRSQLENAYVVADQIPAGNGAHCRVFVAPTAGWYSMILIWNSPWSPPPYNGGRAVFPQRYNPSLGDTLTQCPVPNVP
jgi:hypothetical protein